MPSSKTGEGGSLREPPVEPRRLSPVESGGAGRGASPGNFNMAIPAMVPQTAQPSGFSSTENFSSRGGDGTGMGGASSRDNPTSSRVAYLWQHYASKKISGEVMNLLLSSWRQNQPSRMIPSARSGSAGVLNGVLIPFQDL